MSKQNHEVTNEREKQNNPKAAPDFVAEQVHDQSAVAEITQNLIGEASESAINGQIALPNDIRLSRIQRQAMMAQIGRVSGNQYVQKIISKINGNERISFKVANETKSNLQTLSSAVQVKSMVGQKEDQYTQENTTTNKPEFENQASINNQSRKDTEIRHKSSHRGPVIQRWESLGEEYYHSPPHTDEGVGIIAGVPQPGEGQIVTKTNPIMYGNQQAEGQLDGETEWRSLLGSGGDQAAIKVYAFLRTALLDDAAWLAHVRQYDDGNPAQSQLMTEVGVRFSDASRQVTRPSERQQMALAKAIYLRGRSQINLNFDRYAGLTVLMQEFVSRFQPSLIEGMAENNVRFRHVNADIVARAGSHKRQATMIGSAAGTLTRAAAKFAAWDKVKRATEPRSSDEADAERHKMNAQREAEMAGQLIRGVANTAADIRQEQIEMWKNIIGIALLAIPIPGVGQFVTRTVLKMSETALRGAIEAVIGKLKDTVANDRLKNGLANALAQDDFTKKVQDIRTEVVWLIREFELGDEEDDFVNTVNATLVGAGD